MWEVLSILNVLVMLVITRLAEAEYNEYSRSQYKQITTPFKCIVEGYHPDPHDCRVYYRCVDWGNGSPLTTFKFECGVGTVFSKDKGNICTHPEDSGRSECDKSENELDSNLHDSVEYPSPIWTTQRTTRQPQLTTPQTSTTTRPLIITIETATTIGKFETTTQSLSTNQPIATDHNDINCQNGPQCTQEGFLADTCDCRKFYICVKEGYKFRKYDFTCGVGTVWDPEIQGCNHVWAVTRNNCKQGLQIEDNNNELWNENNNGQWNNDIGNNEGQWDGNIHNTDQPSQSGSGNGHTPDNLVNPDVSDSSSYPGIPGSSEIPGMPDSPGSQNYPGISGFSDATGLSDATSRPGNPGSLGYPDILDYPSSSNSPGTSGILNPSGYPGTSSTSIVSDSSSSSNSLGTETPDPAEYPGIPNSPIAPSSSEIPEITNSTIYPEIPNSSDIPNSPEISSYPHMPSIPGPQSYPERPDSFGTSGVPETTETSGSSGYPEILSSPSSTGISSSPSYPDMSGNPSLPIISGNQSLAGSCREEGFFADSKDCHKFYRCVSNGISFTKYEFQCSPGTVWDSSIQSCNYDYAIPHCKQAGNELGNMSLNEIDNTDESGTSKLPPAQSTENSNILSTSSEPEVKPSTQVVSNMNKPTTSPQITSVSYLPTSPTYPLSTMQVIGSNSYLPPETQMTTSTSYFPSSSVITTSTTSGSMSVSYLSPNTSASINMETVTSTLPSHISSTISSPQSGKSECTEEGFFPNLDDCRKFYRCVQGQSGYQKYDFECGPGTAWDQFIQTCNHIEKIASCSMDTNEITKRPTISNPTSEPTITSSSITIAPSQITTTVSSLVSMTTLNTTVVNTSSQTSTESLTPGADKTETSSMATTSISAITEKPPSEKPENIQMPGHSNTESSSESSSELSISETSSESTELSTESHVPNCTTSKPNNIIICNSEGFYPHPTRCDKFYRCVDNGNGFNVYHFDCPQNTIFDPSINVCNYPESVYPARDCTNGGTASSDSHINTSTISEMPEQSTQAATTQSTSQQTDESTIISTEPDTTISTTEIIIMEQSTVSSIESTTSEISGITESTIEFMTESITTAETATNISMPERTTELTTESTIILTESMESQISITEFPQSTTESYVHSTTEFQEQSTTESQNLQSTEIQEQSTQSQEQSTMESQEQTTTELSQLTTTSAEAVTSCDISNLTEEQIILVCPTGFRRHPKYCNQFYQCTSENNMEIKILVLSCPENTIFDEKKIQCLSPSKSNQTCTNARASARFYKRLEYNTLPPIKASLNRLCPEEGHFPYQQGCSNIFYKCKRDTRNNLQGYLYKCPENFIYWSISRRCEHVTRLPMCSHLTHKNKIDWNDRWQIPMEDFNLSAKMLRFS